MQSWFAKIHHGSYLRPGGGATAGLAFSGNENSSGLATAGISAEADGFPNMRFEINPRDQQELCRRAPEFTTIVSSMQLTSFECSEDIFYTLVQSIVSQQLAVRAADAVFRRVEALLDGKISAERLAAAAENDLRGCGLSRRKIEYLRGIAEAEISGTINFSDLKNKSDAEVIDELVKLRGVGLWTVEMLLIFALGRPDVMSFRDLGIRRGIMILNHLDSLDEAEFEIFRRRCSPYGTLASLYLWKIKDGGLAIPSRPTPSSPV